MKLKKISALAVLFFMASLLSGLDEEDITLTMKLGNKKLRDKTMDVSPGKIYSAQEGKAIPFSRMIEEMNESDFVYIGETHNSLPMHDIQLKIIQALHEQERNLTVGLEMFPVSHQETLNKWNMGILSQEEFIQESQWYVTWNFNFGFYEGIFKLTKDSKIPLYALNAPRKLITQIRMKGWDALSEEEKEIVPNPDLSHEEHRTLIRTIFESAELPHQMKGRGLEMMFEGLYRAQSAWDEVMALNAVHAQKREDKKVVVLVGSGHLLYNLGMNRRAYERSHLPFKTVVCIEIPEGEENIRVSRTFADYIWGIPEEKIPAFPSVGLRLKKFDGLDNLVVESNPINGVALNAGFEKGDVILSVDGKSFFDINELRIYLAQFTWNDEVIFQLLRDARQVEILLKFAPPQEEDELE
ncbi:MAG: ChaN family lipoprotein, partial [Candidatus Aminicenantes bacterium]|nr:ChaN family lipoprotein [Candidatus Aminicenantes bacterium]